MQRLQLKTIFLCLATSVLIAILSITTFGKNIEYKFGLPLLYTLRGPVDPPGNIFILTPYKKTKIGQKTLLRDWDRALHAQILDKLTKLNVDQIAIDILFRQYQDEKNDISLAKSLNANSNIILNQLVSASESGVGSHVLIRNPVSLFSEATASLAPSILVDKTHRKDGFYPYYSVINSHENKDCFAYPADADLPGGKLEDYGHPLHFPRVSTLPVALLEHKLIHYSELSKLLEKFNVNLPMRLCEIGIQLREQFLNKPSLLKEYLDADPSLALKSWLESLVYLKNNLARLNNNPGIFLNFYGQPQTIPTISYEEFDSYYHRHKNSLSESKFNEATVFLGGSFEISDEEKQDNFETAITKNNNRMSGVEISATAFANLLHNQYLRGFTVKSMFLVSLLACGLVFILALLRSDRLLALFIVIAVIFYAYLVARIFSVYSYWLPIFTPFVCMTLSSVLIFAARFLTAQRQKEILKSYVPTAAYNAVETRRNKTIYRESVQGVCMVTDIQGFTAVSERLPAQQMAELMDEYFSSLNQCITDTKGEVYLIDGDSLTAVWTGPADITCENSVKAALSIITKVKNFNEKYFDTPFHTRIGMEYGEFVLGNIGNRSHYTFAVVGSIVYTASRLEQYNKQTNTKILITSNIEKYLAGYRLRDLGEVQFKGLRTLTRVYEVLE